MYSLKNILKQEPNAIRETILVILGTLVLFDVVNLTDKQVVGAGLLASSVLSLLYVRPLTASKDALRKLKKK